MKIIIPMAGLGKRMRPHTLSLPKPLIQVAGKPIVQRLAETISSIAEQQLEELAFVVGDFGKEVEEMLIGIASKLGAKGNIYHQHEPLGTAHAVYCAEPSLDGNIVVAFADTLFRSSFNMAGKKENLIWVKKVEDSRLFGVVKTDDQHCITGFIEKPKNFISDLAIIGIYYFSNGAELRQGIKELIDNKIIRNGEYQLTDVLENMLKAGMPFCAEEVDEWLDCGNKDATVLANRRILETSVNESLIHPSVNIMNSTIKEPCYIGEHVHLENSAIGPFVSIGAFSRIENSEVSNSIIQQRSVVRDAKLENSMIGSHVEYHGKHSEVSIGDYTTLL